ncbi:MAG: two-component sensor histidine kinase [Gammaproteobacteria bacterium]|jgi:signal transduction histidine kinase|nr:two-component sensor histidine kinase [Gammaproteobacteria bacterium]
MAGEWQEASHTPFRYRGLWLAIVVSTCLVSFIPLIVMGFSNYYQYQEAFEDEVKHPIRLLASNARRSLQFYLEERISLLNFIIDDKAFAELRDQKTLEQVFRNLKKNHSGFVDIGLIDAAGVQRSYVGPYGLLDKNYSGQDWLEQVLLYGQHVSDVFLGYRQFPHFSVSVKRLDGAGKPYILRASLNTDIITQEPEPTGSRASRDSFIVNRQGVLQTPSKIFGNIQTPIPLELPSNIDGTIIRDEVDEHRRHRVVGYSPIDKSPFIFVVLEERSTLLASWFALRNKLLSFLIISMSVILIVSLAGATYMVNRLRKADDQRLALLYKVEHTSKMASIGRLAAGVAHEVNNPLAIINEKAGLLKDYVTLFEDFPHKDRFLKHIDPILDSVERCAQITRRLLRFARHIDIQWEPIELEVLLKDVLAFVEKESVYRRLTINLYAEAGLPVIESDRGRLQQVFLNIINNAFDAIEDGGRIDIALTLEGRDCINVTIKDYGIGIPKDQLHSIFEPFYTTKKNHGTGLGLSISYGIVEKLGGKLLAESVEGEWTQFSVILPIKPPLNTRSGGKTQSVIT